MAETFERDHGLRLFRLRRAVGGIANDGDMLEGRVPFAGEAELVALFERMECPLVVLPPDAPIPTPGAEYTIDEYEQLRQPLRAYPRFEAPGRTRVFGVSAYVAVDEAAITIVLAGADGDPYVVTGSDADRARIIEERLERAGVSGLPSRT